MSRIKKLNTRPHNESDRRDGGISSLQRKDTVTDATFERALTWRFLLNDSSIYNFIIAIGLAVIDIATTCSHFC